MKTPEQLRELVAAKGCNTNHFLVTYGGFELFESPNGVVAYVKKPFAWVAAGEPLADPDKRALAWDDFAAEARRHGKGAVCIPVSGEFAAQTAKLGCGSLMIGTEPIFDLAVYPKSGQTWHSVVQTARQLAGKGAKVNELMPDQLTEAKRLELDEIARDWFASRKMGALSFLNRVEPWSGARDKKFFELVMGGRVTAFVAAVPVAPRRGWYLIDVLRRGDTEPGTTELLLLEAMRMLKDHGALEVSLGVAPLAGLGEPPGTRLKRALHAIFERGELFYNFRSLYQFKFKFQPTRWEPAFIVYDGERLSPATGISLLQAFVPRGLIAAGVSGVWRLITHFELQRWIKSLVSPTVVVRSAPSSLFRLVFRCRATFTLVLLMWSTAAATFIRGSIRPSVAQHWAFSFDAFRLHPVHALALSPLLHWNLTHLFLNTMSALLFCGLLEYLGGSLLVGLILVLGAALSNPLASLAFVFGASGATDMDIGSSLGILACAGALASLLRRGWRLELGLALLSAVVAYASRSWLGANHIVSLAVGWIGARLYFRS